MTRRRIVPPGFGWPTSLTPAPAPAGEPSMIQAHNCNKFYHRERPLTLPSCDRLPLPAWPGPGAPRCADPAGGAAGGPLLFRVGTQLSASAVTARSPRKAAAPAGAEASRTRRRGKLSASQVFGLDFQCGHARGHRRGGRCRQRRPGGQRTGRRPGAQHQPDRRAPPDQPRHLRHELRPGRPGTRTQAARCPLGRQRHHQVQLPPRHRQPRQRLVLREHPELGQGPGRAAGRIHRDQFIGQNKRDGADSIITVPLIGWTPKSRAQACGFSVAKYGAQQSADPYDSDCGNGVNTSGRYITGNDPADTSRRAGAAFVAKWAGYLGKKYGGAAAGGVRFYQLDNEPDIWFATHRDVHPAGATYSEMLSKTEKVAAAIKATDPAAKTIGPSGWGWSSLFYSGFDQQYCAAHSCGAVPPDEARHGGVPFATWYLRQLRAYQKQTGVRPLDYFDNHWYPQEANVVSEADDPATQALRLRSTRMLWDPHYVDQSWINQPVMAIPRMKRLVAQNYPGTKVAITEYNFGALDKIDGGLAEADVLGIFGREGLDLATLWGPPAATDPGAFAYRMYLDYDGKGSAFGDTSVRAVSTAQTTLAIYAAQRSSNGALTAIVINKTHHAIASPLTVTGLAAKATAQVFQYGQAGP